MARHLAPFSCRQRMAEMVRRRSFGGVLPLGRHASISGSNLIQCASDTIALSSFQEEQNARHHNQFKVEHALAIGAAALASALPAHAGHFGDDGGYVKKIVIIKKHYGHPGYGFGGGGF